MLDPAEDGDGAEALRKGKDGLVQALVFFGSARRFVRSRGKTGRVVGESVDRVGGAALPSRLGTIAIPAEVESDLEKPGRETALLPIPSQGEVGADKGVLGRFPRLFRIGEPLVAEAKDSLLVSFNE